MQSSSKVFVHLVRRHVRTGTPTISADESVARLIEMMRTTSASGALVVDSQRRLVGIVTERDVTVRIALKSGPMDRVREVMTTPVEALRADDYVYYAIARMRRFGFRHMPVTDERGHPLGMIHLTDAYAVANEPLLQLIERLTHRGPTEELSGLKQAQLELARTLFAEEVPTHDIQSILTHINNDIHRRVLKSALESMEADGHGRPPVEFGAIIMGSGGRGENFLFPDQDNGFVLDDYPDEEHGRIDAFFVELAVRFCTDLDRIGFPLCKGNVMATNPVWRKTRSQWRAQVTGWTRNRGTIQAQLADIFFDFRSCAGAHHFAAELRDHVTRIAGTRPVFLAELFEEVDRSSVALARLGRLAREKDGDHRGQINLKHRGTIPLVGSLRLLSLVHGVPEPSTRGRIDALRLKGVLTAAEHDDLIAAFERITHILLRQQLRDFESKRAVGNHVSPDDLSERERRQLRAALKAIDALQGKVRAEFTGDVFR